MSEFTILSGNRSKKHGAALSQLPIVQNHDESDSELSLQHVYRLLRLRLLKPEDSRLRWQLFRTNQDVANLSSDDHRALFYPSAGDDLLFPVLIGLPVCTDFFFYDVASRGARRNRVQNAIRELAPNTQLRETDVADGKCHEFEFDSVPRRIWIMQKDNMTFLKKEIQLAFFFHRGDSEGEGGSGQRWDSDLLPQLLEKADPNIGCRILTDGEPGGVAEDAMQQLQRVSLPNSYRQRDYFYGVLRIG